MNSYSLRISGVYAAVIGVNVGVCMPVWTGM